MKLGLVVAIIEPRISLTLFDSSYHKTTMAQNQVYWLNPFIRKSSLQSKSCGKLVWKFVLHLLGSFNMVTMTSELELSPLGGIETESNFSFRALGQLASTKKNYDKLIKTSSQAFKSWNSWPWGFLVVAKRFVAFLGRSQVRFPVLEITSGVFFL